MAALVPPAAGTIQRTSVDLGSIPGLLERLDPALVCQRCIAAKLRGDGRSLEASRPVVLTRGSGGSEASRQLSIGGASASVGASRCHAAVRVGAAAAQDDVLVSFEVRRGCLTPDDKWARRVERLLDDCYASNLALDRARLEVAEGIFWKLSIVVTCESDDGAASDCCLLAASAALAASTLPAADIKDGHVALVPNGADPTAAASPARAVPALLLGAPLTCAVVDGILLADPTDAEAATATRVTVVAAVDRANPTDTSKLLKIAVPGGTYAVAPAALARCVALATRRAATVQWPTPDAAGA